MPKKFPKLETIEEERSLHDRIVLGSESKGVEGKIVHDSLIGHHNAKLCKELRDEKRQREIFSNKFATFSLVGTSFTSSKESREEKLDVDKESNILATLTSYLGQGEDKYEIIALPLSNKDSSHETMDSLAKNLPR